MIDYKETSIGHSGPSAPGYIWALCPVDLFDNTSRQVMQVYIGVSKPFKHVAPENEEMSIWTTHQQSTSLFCLLKKKIYIYIF